MFSVERAAWERYALTIHTGWGVGEWVAHRAGWTATTAVRAVIAVQVATVRAPPWGGTFQFWHTVVGQGGSGSPDVPAYGGPAGAQYGRIGSQMTGGV
jgi:hypothetical protein